MTPAAPSSSGRTSAFEADSLGSNPSGASLWMLGLLESILPYVRFAQARGVPGAAFYGELIDGMIWNRAASGIETEGHDPEEGHGAEHESPTGEAGDAQ